MTTEQDLRLDPASAKKCIEVVMQAAIRAWQARGLTPLQIAWKLKINDHHRVLYNRCLKQVEAVFRKYGTDHTATHSILPAKDKAAFAQALTDAGQLAIIEYLALKGADN